MRGFVSSIIGVVLAFILLAIAPLNLVGTIQWAKAESQALAYTQEVIDEVIDTKVLTEEALKDYNLRMASLSNYYSVNVIKEQKVVNPDPVNATETYTTYIVSNDNSKYNSGDRIVIEVKQVGYNMSQTLIQALFGLSIPAGGFTLVGRVR